MGRRKLIGIDDCGRCRETTGRAQRQALGCGYEPPADDRIHLTVWQPPGGERGYRGDPLTVCAGYSCNLHEVIEAAIARKHWEHGAIVPACDGELPTEELLNSILVLDTESSALEGWLMTPAKDGGGGS